MADAYYTTPVAPFHTAAGTTIGTFTTKRDISPAPCPVIWPGMLRIGSKIKIECEGEWSSTGSPTFVLGLYYGVALDASTGIPLAITGTLAESAAVTVGAGAAAWPWRMEWRGLVTALGTAGSVLGQGDLEAAGTAISSFSSTQAIPITQALRTVAIPTGGPLVVGVCATCSASSASNTVKVNNLSVQLLN